MQRANRLIEKYVLWLIDMLCIHGAYLLATYIRYAGRWDWGDRTQHYMVGILFLFFCTIYSFFVDWNRNFLIRGDFRELVAVAQYHLLMLPVTLTVVFMLRWSRILSRNVIGNFTILSFLFMLAAHLICKRIFRRVLSTDQLTQRMVVVTQKQDLEDTLLRIAPLTELNYRIVGIACIEPEEAEALINDDSAEGAAAAESGPEGIPVYTGAAGLTRRLTQLSFDEVFINTPDIPQRCAAALISRFEDMGVVCHYTLDLPSIGKARSHVGTLGGYSVVSYSRYEDGGTKYLVKRLMDIAGGIVGLLITAILTVFIAPAILMDSPGPVFFSQIRVGKNGRRFRIYKFRSMYRDAEERKKELEAQNEMSGPMFKIGNDPRITRVGAFLRRTSLDEFPQFFNVLRGDMSLVGTRPPTEEEFEQYDEYYRRRISMKPGLTGLWQVSGRSEIEKFDDVVKMDLKYIDNWSLQLDVKILLQTVQAVLGGRGAR